MLLLTDHPTTLSRSLCSKLTSLKDSILWTSLVSSAKLLTEECTKHDFMSLMYMINSMGPRTVP